MSGNLERIIRIFCGSCFLFFSGCSANKLIQTGTNTTRAGVSNSQIVGSLDSGENYKIYDRNKLNFGIFSELQNKNLNFEAGIYFLNVEYYHTAAQSAGSSVYRFGMLGFPISFNHVMGERFGDSILRLRAGLSAGIMIWAQGTGSGYLAKSGKADFPDLISLGPTVGASYTFCRIGRKSWLGLYCDLYRGIRPLDLAYLRYGIELRYQD